MARNLHRPGLWFGLVVLLGLSGCFTTKEERIVVTGRGITYGTAEVRTVVLDFVRHFMATVENSADEIMAETSDPSVKRNARLWKMNAIPACHRAVFEENPMVAFLDTWLLCMQMQFFFEEGKGKSLFGDSQNIGIEASKHLETRMYDSAKSIYDGARGMKPLESNDYRDVDELRQGLIDLAEEYPVRSLTLERESLSPHLSRILAIERGGVFSTISNLKGDLLDFMGRLSLVLDSMPRQVVWQSEVLVDEVLERDDIVTALGNVDRVTQSIERVSTVSDSLPPILESVAGSVERVSGVAEDLPSILEKERIAVVGSVDALRKELVADVDGLKKELITDVDGLRNAVVGDVDSLSQQLIQQSSDKVSGLIDVIFWRALQLVGTMAILALVVGVVIKKAGPRRSRAQTH